MSDQESLRDTRFARVARSRASKACLACRARKVRCDVVHRDGQCTNCVLDKRQCIVDLSLLSELDAQFLEAQGCFKAPCRQAADEFMREYFLHVHPNLPLLDESVFWNMYHRNGYATQNGRTSFSLFLFQAMLFASCSFMSLNTIRSLGFTSLRDARDTYYRRAKLLFDFCGETSPVANAQGALLLSYNATMRYQKRINSIWLVTAIQLAQAAGAHRFYLKQDQDPEVKNVLKRLWWCCIVRDRILPLGVRRHLYIPLVDFDPEKAALTEDDFAHEIGFSRVYDAETKRSLIRLFITLCDLAVALTDVITTVYATGQPLDVRFLSVLKLQQTVSCIQSSKVGLDAWFERASIRFPAPAGMMSTNKSLVLYTNLMYIYYQ
ncbi:Cutinase transcription factor 1 beta [Ilyonectria robusta]